MTFYLRRDGPFYIATHACAQILTDIRLLCEFVQHLLAGWTAEFLPLWFALGGLCWLAFLSRCLVRRSNYSCTRPGVWLLGTLPTVHVVSGGRREHKRNITCLVRVGEDHTCIDLVIHRRTRVFGQCELLVVYLWVADIEWGSHSDNWSRTWTYCCSRRLFFRHTSWILNCGH